jgi:hypothetical protein
MNLMPYILLAKCPTFFGLSELYSFGRFLCSVRGRLHGAFFMCVSMSDKPFDAEACDNGGQASATNGLTDATNGLSDMKNAPCNQPLSVRINHSTAEFESTNFFVN